MTNKCGLCTEDKPCNFDNCPNEECDHDDIDEGYCLNCGEDLTEELAAKAYDSYKASRYNGDY